MRKLLALMLASALVIGGLAACNKEKDTSSSDGTDISSSQTDIESPYKDGEYKATYKTMALDRTVDFITVKVEGGKPEITEYSCREEAGPAEEGGETAASSGAATEAETKARAAMKDILNNYNEVNGKLDQMELQDTTAAEHYYRFQRMMREVLGAAEKGKTGEIMLGKYMDGTYKVTAPEENAQGWTPYIEATVTDGTISAITYDALKDGKKITEDTEANAAESKPSEYYAQIAKNFTSGGEDLTKLSSPSGAGLATRGFVKLMTPLQNHMISGADKEFTAPLYLDGTYKAQFSDFNEDGWKEYVVLKIFNGKVTVEEFDAVDPDKKLRSENAEVNKQIQESTGTYTFQEIQERLDKNLTAAGGDPLAIETVAGATISTNNFKRLAGEILYTTAREGKTDEVLEVERIESVKQ